jgi:hypothetical protein
VDRFPAARGGGAFADEMAQGYGWSDGAVTGWNVPRWSV